MTDDVIHSTHIKNITGAFSVISRVSYSQLPWTQQKMWHGSEAYAGKIFRGKIPM